MLIRFISNPTAAAGIRSVKLSATAQFGKINVRVDMRTGGQAVVRGAIKVCDGAKRANLCATLYSARTPFIQEVGMESTGLNLRTKKSDRRWLMASPDVWASYPKSFSPALLKKSGASDMSFAMAFPSALLNENYYENIIVVASSEYLRAAPKKAAFSGNIQDLDSPEEFSTYLEFLKNNRAYLSDFALSALISNPGVIISDNLASWSSFSFR